MDTKEVVASVLSLVLVGFAVYCMSEMFWAPSDISDRVWQQRSSVLQIAIGMAGTVTGYYFGRIPAERSAAVSQQVATVAQQGLAIATVQADKAIQNEQRIRTNLIDLKNELGTPLGGGAPDSRSDQFCESISSRLDNILRS